MRHGVDAAGDAFGAGGGRIDRRGGRKELPGGVERSVVRQGCRDRLCWCLGKVLCLFVALFREVGHARFVAEVTAAAGQPAGNEPGERVAEASRKVGGCVCA